MLSKAGGRASALGAHTGLQGCTPDAHKVAGAFIQQTVLGPCQVAGLDKRTDMNSRAFITILKPLREAV